MRAIVEATAHIDRFRPGRRYEVALTPRLEKLIEQGRLRLVEGTPSPVKKAAKARKSAKKAAPKVETAATDDAPQAEQTDDADNEGQTAEAT
jgi:hypothetical protein